MMIKEKFPSEPIGEIKCTVPEFNNRTLHGRRASKFSQHAGKIRSQDAVTNLHTHALKDDKFSDTCSIDHKKLTESAEKALIHSSQSDKSNDFGRKGDFPEQVVIQTHDHLKEISRNLPIEGNHQITTEVTDDIDEENKSYVLSLSPQEVEQHVRDLTARLSSETIEFLKNRGSRSHLRTSLDVKVKPNTASSLDQKEALDSRQSPADNKRSKEIKNIKASKVKLEPESNGEYISTEDSNKLYSGYDKSSKRYDMDGRAIASTSIIASISSLLSTDLNKKSGIWKVSDISSDLLANISSSLLDMLQKHGIIKISEDVDDFDDHEPTFSDSTKEQLLWNEHGLTLFAISNMLRSDIEAHRIMAMQTVKLHLNMRDILLSISTYASLSTTMTATDDDERVISLLRGFYCMSRDVRDILRVNGVISENSYAETEAALDEVLRILSTISLHFYQSELPKTIPISLLNNLIVSKHSVTYKFTSLSTLKSYLSNIVEDCMVSILNQSLGVFSIYGNPFYATPHIARPDNLSYEQYLSDCWSEYMTINSSEASGSRPSYQNNEFLDDFVLLCRWHAIQAFTSNTELIHVLISYLSESCKVILSTRDEKLVIPQISLSKMILDLMIILVNGCNKLSLKDMCNELVASKCIDRLVECFQRLVRNVEAADDKYSQHSMSRSWITTNYRLHSAICIRNRDWVKVIYPTQFSEGFLGLRLHKDSLFLGLDQQQLRFIRIIVAYAAEDDSVVRSLAESLFESYPVDRIMRMISSVFTKESKDSDDAIDVDKDLLIEYVYLIDSLIMHETSRLAESLATTDTSNKALLNIFNLIDPMLEVLNRNIDAIFTDIIVNSPSYTDRVDIYPMRVLSCCIHCICSFLGRSNISNESQTKEGSVDNLSDTSTLKPFAEDVKEYTMTTICRNLTQSLYGGHHKGVLSINSNLLSDLSGRLGCNTSWQSIHQKLTTLGTSIIKNITIFDRPEGGLVSHLNIVSLSLLDMDLAISRCLACLLSSNQPDLDLSLSERTMLAIEMNLERNLQNVGSAVSTGAFAWASSRLSQQLVLFQLSIYLNTTNKSSISENRNKFIKTINILVSLMNKIDPMSSHYFKRTIFLTVTDALLLAYCNAIESSYDTRLFDTIRNIFVRMVSVRKDSQGQAEDDTTLMRMNSIWQSSFSKAVRYQGNLNDGIEEESHNDDKKLLSSSDWIYHSLQSISSPIEFKVMLQFLSSLDVEGILQNDNSSEKLFILFSVMGHDSRDLWTKYDHDARHGRDIIPSFAVEDIDEETIRNACQLISKLTVKIILSMNEDTMRSRQIDSDISTADKVRAVILSQQSKFNDLAKRYFASGEYSSMLQSKTSKSITSGFDIIIHRFLEAAIFNVIDVDLHISSIYLFLSVIAPWRYRERIWRELSESKLIHALETDELVLKYLVQNLIFHREYRYEYERTSGSLQRAIIKALRSLYDNQRDSYLYFFSLLQICFYIYPPYSNESEHLVNGIRDSSQDPMTRTIPIAGSQAKLLIDIINDADESRENPDASYLPNKWIAESVIKLGAFLYQQDFGQYISDPAKGDKKPSDDSRGDDPSQLIDDNRHIIRNGDAADIDLLVKDWICFRDSNDIMDLPYIHYQHVCPVQSKSISMFDILSAISDASA